ncbi:hypothetical protein CTA2_8863 [Colletotrichum tanaceti]|uniref:Uncharacterized protein n=1 Tax=Colletotrichum tanaceti TaxID=1306861 RepID=A0A4U6XA46_9PEZI|nr:hypothetical protein CTA2_8863 [Colletotrichum tanaceti]TKW52528.1 hypothetical protein CTA1_8796 [Colletotrichum tanaceti]
MTERSGDMVAKRIFVSVSKKSQHWSRAWLDDRETINVAIGLLNSHDPPAQITDADAMLVVKEMWPMRIWIVLDIFNTEYDPSQAHLPGRNDLPVVAISLGNGANVTVAGEALRDRVNKGVRDAHDLHGDGSRAPFQINHANNNIPTYPRPRIRNSVTLEDKERR